MSLYPERELVIARVGKEKVVEKEENQAKVLQLTNSVHWLDMSSVASVREAISFTK